jgi:hypothetical protein
MSRSAILAICGAWAALCAIVIVSSRVEAMPLSASPMTGRVQVHGRLTRNPLLMSPSGQSCVAWNGFVYDLEIQFGYNLSPGKQWDVCDARAGDDVWLVDGPARVKVDAETAGWAAALNQDLRPMPTEFPANCERSHGRRYYLELCALDGTLVVVHGCRDATGIHPCAGERARVWQPGTVPYWRYIVDWKRFGLASAVALALGGAPTCFLLVRRRRPRREGAQEQE